MKEGEEEAPNQSSSLGLSRSGKSPMYITQSQLELLVATPQIGERTDTELCLDDSGISSLDTLPPNLRKLSCRRNRLSYVVGLPAKLEYLDLTENRVSSLEGIERCAGLQTLLLGSNALAQCDLSGLTELKRLRVLDLSGNGLRDDERTRLLQNMRHIECLCLDQNKLHAWTVGAETRGLRELRLDGNQICELEFAGSRDCLERLSAKSNLLGEIDAVFVLKNVRQVELDRNRIEAVGVGINSLAHIEVLSLSHNKIHTLPLLRLPGLTKLFLADNELTSLRFAEGLGTLVELSVADNSISELPSLPALEKLEVLDISHNQLRTADNLSLLRSLKDLSISFNQIKSQDGFCEELFKMSTLAKVDARQNLFNSGYYVESERKETDLYRYALIYNFSQTITTIDGVAVTNDERANTFLYYSQQPAGDTMKNTRLFKLTETLDTQLVKIHEIMDSARKELSKHDVLRQSHHFGSTRGEQNNVSSILREPDSEAIRAGSQLEPHNSSLDPVPDLRPTSVCEVRHRVPEKDRKSIDDLSQQFNANVKEFAGALDEFRKKTTGKLTTASTNSLRQNPTVPDTIDNEKSFQHIRSEEQPCTNSGLSPVMSMKDKNMPLQNQYYLPDADRDESRELVAALDIKGEGKVADRRSLQEKPRDSANVSECREEPSRQIVGKIATEFRKVFREELDALRSDLRTKLDRYKEAKNMSTRTVDCSFRSRKPAEEVVSEEALRTIQKKCEDNERKLHHMRHKMSKLVRAVRQNKENEGAQKQFYDSNIEQLKQRIATVESTSFTQTRVSRANSAISRSFVCDPDSSGGNSSFMQPQTFHVNVQTDAADSNPARKLLDAEAAKALFLRHSKGNRAIPATCINQLARDLMEMAPAGRKTVSDAIVDLTKTASRVGYITLDTLISECGLKEMGRPRRSLEPRKGPMARRRAKSQWERTMTQPKSGAASKEEETGTKSVRKEVKYMRQLQRFLCEELTRGTEGKAREALSKLFCLRRLLLHDAVGLLGRARAETKKTFRARLASGAAQVLFYAGSRADQRKVVERKLGAQLVFTNNIDISLKLKEKQILVAAVELGKCIRVEDRTKGFAGYDGMHDLFREDADSLYYANDGLYIVKSIDQICPAYIVEYHS